MDAKTIQFETDGGAYDGAVVIDRAADDMTFKDVNNATPVTLSEAIDGGADGTPRYLNRAANTYFIENSGVVELWIAGVLKGTWGD